ncbi:MULTISPECIES: hypothetical protein [unclassified Enterococcus]|uniref:hypothetical protein n=1 Tax=unclassified Enterococcus TaxID=2608891 RepID=UPI001CE11EBA|nr:MULTISPECIES: hypothetical protein [unclassified Enterococcus]MCA5014391.1 hypothetical protein [Enterococcus sp. S23]MCA5017496.1 hypothetical protein [Enterococcus sp. S22(2020)]
MHDNKINDNRINEFLSTFRKNISYGYTPITQFLPEPIEVTKIETRDVLNFGKMVTKMSSKPKSHFCSLQKGELFTRDLLDMVEGKYHNVFFSPSIYRVYRRKKEYALYLTALFVDIDHCSVREALERIKSLPEELQAPTFIIRSGAGVHVYYVLGFKPKASKYVKLWEHTMEALRHILDGDPKVIESARLMRLPYTWNTKANAMCEFVSFHPERSFDLIKVADCLGVFKKYKTKSSYSKNKQKKKAKKKIQYQTNSYSQDFKNEIIELTKLRATHGLDIGNRNNTLFLLKQLRATDKTLDYVNNEIFSEPLSDTEITYIKEYGSNTSQPLSFPNRAKSVTKLQVTAEEQKLFRYLVDEDVYETRKAIAFIKDRPLYSLMGYLLKLLQRKYAKKKNVSLKTLAKELKISTKTVSKFRSSRNQREDYLQVTRRLNEVKQEVERVTTNYLSTLNKDKNKQPVVEELQEFQELLEKLEVLIEQSKEFQKKRLTMTEYKKLLRLINKLEELRNGCL